MLTNGKINGTAVKAASPQTEFALYLLREAAMYEGLARIASIEILAEMHSWMAEHLVKTASWAQYLAADSPETYDARDRAMMSDHLSSNGRAQ
jgi:hypothetical protein